MVVVGFSRPNIFEMLKDLAKNSTTVYSRMPIEPTAAILKKVSSELPTIQE
jgi:hypothetical protein